jgi:SRSO17 transposase
MGERGPQGVQRLLNGAVWDVEGVRDDLRHSVIDHLGEAGSGLLIVDETGFLKKGKQSCGVGRQYTGTAGGTENAQVGVFLAYASGKGAAFIDRALYLPRAWTSDPRRRAAAGIPKQMRFATKLTLAKRMLQRAFDAHVPARWIVADSGYGRSGAFRGWLEQRGRAYVVMIPKTTAVEYRGRRERAEQLGERIPEEAWQWCCQTSSEFRASGGPDAADSPDGLSTQPYQWVCLTLSSACASGKRRWLLIRRDPEDPSDLAFYLACGPETTAAPDLMRVAHERWAIEEGFAQAKGEVGLDHYEVRTWRAWHRFVTLSLLAHAALVVMRARASAGEIDAAAAAQPTTDQKRGPHPSSSRSRCLKSAGGCWRCAKRRSDGPSAWAGRSGDGRTKRWPPALTRRSGHSACAGTRPPVPVLALVPVPVPGVPVRPSSHRPRWDAPSPTASGSASFRCSHRNARRLGVRAMTTARC